MAVGSAILFSKDLGIARGESFTEDSSCMDWLCFYHQSTVVLLLLSLIFL